MAEVTEVRLRSWEEFPLALDQLTKSQAAKEAANGRKLSEPLFRGLGNSEWTLETTLERSVDAFPTETLLSYYRRIARSKPVVESLINRSWDEIPEWPEFDKLLQDESANWIDRILSQNSAIYQYLVYLRHHGFPSPILDWTASPFIAAMFAFDAMDRAATNVLIYVYVRDSLQSFGSDAHLFIAGPYLRTHPRHYLQQSRYSLCVQLRAERQGHHPHVDYHFLSHNEALIQNVNDDLIVKIVVPASERKRALMQLDSMNLNPYSLYGSEESLIRTIARREMLFKRD